MTDLFAGFPVSDFERASQWYRTVLGTDPAFSPHDHESVWAVGEHAYVYIELLPERAGGSLSMVMVDDLDSTIAGVSARGIEPLRTEKYEAGMRKVVYQDPDGNELSFGGTSAEQ